MYTLTTPLTLEQAREQAKKQAETTGAEVTIYSMAEHEKVAAPYIKGKWYYGENDGDTWISRFKEIRNKEFWHSELYFSSGGQLADDYCTMKFIKGLATPEQIEAHLKAAAKAKGLVERVEIVDIFGDKGIINSIKYVSGQDALWANHGELSVYQESKWATISESQPEQKPLTITYTNEQGERITVQGTNVEVK